jgi:hypothetical protein
MTRLVFLVALASVATAAAKPVKIERNGGGLEFSFDWSADAAAVPALDRRFHREMQKAFASARANAREDKRLAREQKRQFNPHFYSVSWTTAGETPLLLSLQRETGSFEGGAHPNTSYGALLWDRASGRETSVTSLFGRPGAFAALTRAAYCRALDAERSRRREGVRLGGEFDRCPQYSGIAILPVDRSGNGRFDAIALVASPYVAGPYVEGEYEILLPVTARLIAALKPRYRGSFEAQRQ